MLICFDVDYATQTKYNSRENAEAENRRSGPEPLLP
jgi:hypothetical protein